MTDDINATPSRDQLRQEAAEWFAVMRGPEAEKSQEAFESWLARSEAHTRAYNSICQTFKVTAALKPTARGEPSRNSMAGSRTDSAKVIRTSALASIALVAATSLGFFAWQKHQPASEPTYASSARAEREARYVTSIGEIRNFVLIDGSRMTLDTNSIVLAYYTAGQRGFRLVQGRARFYVSKDKRPFIVRARSTAVTAHGTIFDVELGHGKRIDIHLLQGLVDVQSQTDAVHSSKGAVTPSKTTLTHLAVGQRLTIGDLPLPPRLSANCEETWPDGVEAFNNVALSELVAATNRYTKKPVVVGDPQIAAMRISGTFHLTDTAAVTGKVADLLNLAMSEDQKAYRLGRREK
ncbi:FecR family protein [Novosphingobium rosa]|uniref:FecR family protein n=1 Tax=Novosphingobium rosa TaxID=76978 RepID=UPI00082BE2A6|nr:FecR domain-containing protein [Novosphingobium rosa]